LSFVASIASYFIIAANIGIETYGQKVISVNRENKAYLKRILIEITLLRAILTAICLIVYYVTFVVVLDSNSVLYAIYGISLMAVAFDFTWFFQGVEDFKKIAFANIFSKILYVVLVFVFIKEKQDLNLAALILVLTNALPYFLLIPCLFKFVLHIKVDQKINPFSHFKECMVYFVPTIAIQIYTILDKTMIGLITQSDFENGYYEKAEQLAKLPITIITTMNVIMRSRISYYFANKEFDKIKELTKKSASFTLLIAVPIVFGLIIIAKRFVPIYLGEGYEECIPLLYIFSPLILIIGISNLLGTHYYTPYDKQRTSNRFLIIGAIVNIALNAVLIYFLKARGAAISTVAAELVITILYLCFAKEFFTLKDFIKVGYKYIIAGVVMFLALLPINYYLPQGTWYLVLEVAIGICIYFVMLFLTKDAFLLNTIKTLFHKVYEKLRRS
ncbi:MAG: polysaccharide biosynthesis C-terminal domain-containing protein, partial [Anaeroplasmataceae bacterium]|nr:polysaccharide biosynthesis C-terminal domain-containing protein [Anaeroplasmataceae bacterium]